MSTVRSSMWARQWWVHSQHSADWASKFSCYWNSSSVGMKHAIAIAYWLLRSSFVKSEPSDFKIIPVLQVGIILADGWYRNQPPKHQPIDDQWVPRRNPQAELEKECVQLDNHENNAKAQNLDESPRTQQGVPLILVPLCWCELA